MEEEKIRERLGKLAYDTYFGKYGNWETAPAMLREKWREVAETLVTTVAPAIIALTRPETMKSEPM